VNGIVALVMTSGATYLMGILSIPKQVGYFGSAERFATLALSLLGPAAQVFLPRLTKLQLEDERAAFRLAGNLILIEITFGVLAGTFAFLFAPIALPFILGKSFGPSAAVLQVLALLLPFAAVTHSLSNYILLPLRRERQTLIGISTGALAMLACAPFLVGKFNAVGMAEARIFGEIIASLVMSIVCWRLGYLRFRQRSQN
jgi:PST family polysaccharide transporter